MRLSEIAGRCHAECDEGRSPGGTRAYLRPGGRAGTMAPAESASCERTSGKPCTSLSFLDTMSTQIASVDLPGFTGVGPMAPCAYRPLSWPGRYTYPSQRLWLPKQRMSPAKRVPCMVGFCTTSASAHFTGRECPWSGHLPGAFVAHRRTRAAVSGYCRRSVAHGAASSRSTMHRWLPPRRARTESPGTC
jgi:hypothetical protein